MATSFADLDENQSTNSRGQWALGPGSVTWRVLRDPVVFFVGMGRTTLVLPLHPPFSASIEHDTFHTDPVLRFKKIAMYAYGTAFGTCDDAERVSNMVRTRHGQVSGIDAITQRPYQAYSEYELAITHLIQTHCFLVIYEEIYGRLSNNDRDKFFLEQKLPSAMIGINPAHMPDSYEQAMEWMGKIRLRFALTAAGRMSLASIDSTPYPKGSVIGDLPRFRRFITVSIIRAIADMSRITLDPAEDDLISFRRKPYLRSRKLIRISLKLFSRLFRAKRFQAVWDDMLSKKIAASYRRALVEQDAPGAELRTVEFVIPDANDHFYPLPGLKRNWPGDPINYAIGSDLEGPVLRGSITKVNTPGSALRLRIAS